MKRPGSPRPNKPSHQDALMHRWAIKIAIYSLLLILILTLFPFDFSANQYSSFTTIADNFSHRFTSADVIINILLFMPLGFGLMGCLYQRSQTQFQEAVSFTVVLLSCLILSLAIEILQLFSPSRYPSFADVVSNSLGGLLGLFSFLQWRYELFYWTITQRPQTRSHVSFRVGVITFLGYAIFIFFISSHLQTTASIGNWSLFVPLLLGNDQTGQHPWQGFVTDVAIADRSLTESDVERVLTTKNLATVAQDSVVASYKLTHEKEKYWDRSGHSPHLIWQGELAKVEERQITGRNIKERDDNNRTVLLSSKRWLVTEGDAIDALDRIRRAAQFTLSITLAPENVEQTGPARILTLSADRGSQNLTLGQEKSSLVIWLRTLRAKDQRVQPELVFPGIFKDVQMHHLIITYDGSVVRCYIDHPHDQHRLELYPGLACPLCTSLSPFSSQLYRFLYYSILFAPAGYIVGLFTITLRRQLLLQILSISGGMLILPFLQEFVLANTDWNRIRGDNFLISILITASITLAVNILQEN